ncbi:MAG: ANTAR domain-containing protein, partial [Acidimicrobiia bacterium]
DCFREGAPIECEELDAARTRWPRFAPAALAAGFASAYALPMRLRNQTIGSLNLLRAFPGPLNPDDLGAAQALADVATIGILQHRLAEKSNLLSEQLQSALSSRVIIEQAKGVLAEYGATTMDLAFGSLRRYARNHNAHLTDVARDIVARDLRPDAVFDGPVKPSE